MELRPASPIRTVLSSILLCSSPHLRTTADFLGRPPLSPRLDTMPRPRVPFASALIEGPPPDAQQWSVVLRNEQKVRIPRPEFRSSTERALGGAVRPDEQRTPSRCDGLGGRGGWGVRGEVRRGGRGGPRGHLPGRLYTTRYARRRLPALSPEASK
jgi:hypothetical protein